MSLLFTALSRSSPVPCQKALPIMLLTGRALLPRESSPWLGRSLTGSRQGLSFLLGLVAVEHVHDGADDDGA